MKGEKEMEKLIIIGAGGHGRVVADIAEGLGCYNEISFLDDDSCKDVSPYKVIGKVNEYESFVSDYDFVIAVGSNSFRKELTSRLEEKGANLVSLVHKNATVGSGVEIEKGVVVMAGAVINNRARIGKGVIVNTCASVDHDCIIGDFAHISVGAHLAGTVEVGDEVFVCAGATVINNVNICGRCVIGAGAVVIRNIETVGTYIGIPAELKKPL